MRRIFSSPLEEVQPGNVVWFPPDEKNCYGSALTAIVAQIAI
jgi:hypothetical protein